MIESGIYKNLLFIDVKTISLTKSLEELPLNLRKHWNHKASFINRDELSSESLFFNKAGLYAEFGKIIAISIGFLYLNNGVLKSKIKTLSGDNEVQVLMDFTELINKYNQQNLVLCAHNGKEFDYPYLSRRLLVNKLIVPDSLKLSGKKPWEINHLDTLEMWRFGDRKQYTSLELIGEVLDIKPSKWNVSASEINSLYYEKKEFVKLVEYSSRGIYTLIQVYLRLNEMNTLEYENIDFV